MFDDMRTYVRKLFRRERTQTILRRCARSATKSNCPRYPRVASGLLMAQCRRSDAVESLRGRS